MNRELSGWDVQCNKDMIKTFDVSIKKVEGDSYGVAEQVKRGTPEWLGHVIKTNKDYLLSDSVRG